jgi:hypothetical protein
MMLYGYDVNGLCQKNNLEMESIGAWICGSWHGFSHLREDTRLFVRCVFSDVYLDWLDLFALLLAVLVIVRLPWSCSVFSITQRVILFFLVSCIAWGQ